MIIEAERVHVAISDKKELVYAVLYKIPKEFPGLMQGLLQFEGESIEDCHKQAKMYFDKLVEIEEMDKSPLTVECADLTNPRKDKENAEELIEKTSKETSKKKK